MKSKVHFACLMNTATIVAPWKYKIDQKLLCPAGIFLSAIANKHVVSGGQIYEAMGSDHEHTG
jgi:hypothetical protein